MEKTNMDYFNEHRGSLFDIEAYNKKMAPIHAAYNRIDFKGIANCLIDEAIESYGVNWMIHWLMDFGLNSLQIEALGFESEDIREAYEDQEEEL